VTTKKYVDQAIEERAIKIARATDATSDISTYTYVDGAAQRFYYENANNAFDVKTIGAQIKEFSNGLGFSYQPFYIKNDGTYN
jgi:hypothetical protein